MASFLRELFGIGTIGREMAETRNAWAAAESAWLVSPLSSTTSGEIAVSLALDTARASGVWPPEAALLALAEAIAAIVESEDIAPFEPDWSAISSSIPLAYEFRQATTRRRLWAASFDRCISAVREALISRTIGLLQALPDAEQVAAGEAFEVPLLDFLPDPASAIEDLLRLPFDHDASQLGILERLRERHLYNAQMASGITPGVDTKKSLILPTEHKERSSAALARLYLAGSPFLRFLETPLPFRVPESVRYEHAHVVGGTGHGKTQLLQKLIHADLLAAQADNRSVVVIDSQGDLLNKLMRLELFSPAVPNSLADRLIVIDPADVEFPAALNLFDAHLDRVRQYSPADRERVLNGVVELYELFFGSFLGAELTQKQGVIFRYLARLMLAVPDATIHTLMRVMEDGAAFRPYMQQLDGSARYFFETEFFHPSFAATKKQILRRLWGVLSTPAFERMLTQPKNKLDLFEATNSGKVILISTAKDLLKQEGSQLLGRFFIAMLAQAALERSTIPEAERTPTFVYVDEAQEYFDDNIETILSQARKYKLSLTMAHQTLDQLSPRLRSAMFSNTSVKCAGGVSAKDARSLADELRTEAEFIESMTRRGDRTEFALYVKQATGRAIRLSVPLGFVERQPTLDEEEFEALVARNRAQYCGTLAAIAMRAPIQIPALPVLEEGPEPPKPEAWPRAPEPLLMPLAPRPAPSARREPSPVSEAGKGGKQHKYLQALIKELAEQSGLKATIEAALTNRSGQVDVLIERDGVVAAIEISVTTPAEHEKENLRKCLDEGFSRIAVVLAKSKRSQASYRAALIEPLSPPERERVSFLTPEELPEFIAALAPEIPPAERVVKGYRVKSATRAASADDARARETVLLKLMSSSLARAAR